MIGSLEWMPHFAFSRWRLSTKPEAAATLLVRENLPQSINPNQKQKLFRKSNQKLLFKVTLRPRSRQQQSLPRNRSPQFLERRQRKSPLPIARKITKYSN